MEDLYGWIFTYNCYVNKWLATTRDHYLDLFSIPYAQNKNIIASSNVNTLIDIIVRTKGKPDLLDTKVKVEVY